MPAVVQLRSGKALTVRAAADAFPGSLTNLNTARGYGTAVGKTAERLGEDRPLAAVADDEVGEALEQLWGTASVNTWNARRAAVLAWLGWCADHGYDGPAVPAWVKRMTPPDSDTPARPKLAVDRLIGRRRSRCGRRPCGGCSTRRARGRRRSSGVNIEDLDLPGRRAPVKAKSRHRKADNVRRYFKPSPEAIAEVTSLLAPIGGRL